WFRNEAAARNLQSAPDATGNLWAWWHPPAARDGALDQPRGNTGVIVTGSHLDSVPDGGPFDGPLGVVSAFAAIDLLTKAGVTPVRPVGVVAFMEEEGARFGMACLGSRLLTGAVTPKAARELTDADGVSLAEAMAGAGLDPDALGPDPELVGR